MRSKTGGGNGLGTRLLLKHIHTVKVAPPAGLTPPSCLMDGKEAPSAASAGDGEDEGDRQEEREAGGAEKSSQKWWIGLWGKRRLMQNQTRGQTGA